MSNNFEKWFWSRNTLSDRLAPSVTRMQCFFPFIEGLLQRTEEFTRSPDQKFANKTKRRIWRTRNPMFYGEAEWIPSGEQKKNKLYLNHNWEIPTNNNSTEEDQCLKKASHFTGQLSREIIDKKIHKQATIDVLCRTTFQMWLFFTQKSRDIANFWDSVTKFGYAVTEVSLG